MSKNISPSPPPIFNPQIPNAVDVTTAAPIVIGTMPVTMAGKICGGVLSAVTGTTAADAYAAATFVSVCSKEAERKCQFSCPSGNGRSRNAEVYRLLF